MSDSKHAVQVKLAGAACVAYLPMKGPYSQIPEAFGRLYGWVAEKGLAPDGMPSGVFLTDPALGEASARWELRAQLAGDHAEAPVDASGCGIKHLPPRLVVSAIHRGPYEQVGPVYEELAAWVLANDYSVVGPPEELYFSEPATPPEETVTEVLLPVAKG
jgi:AraC family transcriptional regulator